MLAVLTSLYCLLAYIPDTYFAFIQAPFQPWVVALIHFHPYLYLCAFLLLSLSMLSEYTTGGARRMVLEFVAFHAALAIFFFVKQPFSHVGNNSLSFLWSLAALFPLLWIGMLDRVAQWEPQAGQEPDSPRQIPFVVALLAGAAIGLLYPAGAWLRYLLAGKPPQLGADDFLIWVWAITVQLLFALFVAALFNLTAALASRVRATSTPRFLLYALPATAFVAILFERVFLASIPLIGLEARIYSVMIGLSLVLFGAGVWHWIKPYTSAPSTSPQPRSWREATSTRNAALALVVIAASYTVPALIGVNDWKSLLAKI